MQWAILPLFPNGSASLHFRRYSFSVPQSVRGWVGLDGWLHTEMVCPSEDGHPSKYQLTDSAAAGDRTHDHWVASPTSLTTRLPSHGSHPKVLLTWLYVMLHQAGYYCLFYLFLSLQSLTSSTSFSPLESFTPFSKNLSFLHYLKSLL